jgi:chromosome transmission fidelity protein 4
LQEAERQARLNQKRAEEAEAEAKEVKTQWIITRNEIELINEELGRGGWGAVTVANFRGTKVAAKCFYRELSSDYYQKMFTREMTMAARLRHPNLVQFIGASVEGNVIILTDLMTTSLRTELEKGPMNRQQITSISLDVARALNYLHLMQPHPIIHRDISSANVLLDPLPGNGWKVKVSDYGSVNVLTCLQTVGPGNPVYAAPEANIPGLQSPKMDIFSFGVLLVEMLTHQFPEVSSRHRLIASIDHVGYLDLIEECLSEERDNRPSAQQLLARLNDINILL